METTIFVLQVLLYIIGIILLVVLTILGIRSIQVLDKADKTIDNINNKVNSLTTLFNTIDKVSTGVSYVTNTFVDKATSAISKIFRSKRKGKRGRYIWVKRIRKVCSRSCCRSRTWILFAPKKGTEIRKELKEKLMIY